MLVVEVVEDMVLVAGLQELWACIQVLNFWAHFYQVLKLKYFNC
jgi:hypothetical protein